MYFTAAQKGQAGMALAVIIAAVICVEANDEPGNVLPKVRPFGMTIIAVLMGAGGFIANMFKGDEVRPASQIDIPLPPDQTEENGFNAQLEEESAIGVSTYPEFYQQSAARDESSTQNESP